MKDVIEKAAEAINTGFKPSWNEMVESDKRFRRKQAQAALVAGLRELATKTGRMAESSDEYLPQIIREWADAIERERIET